MMCVCVCVCLKLYYVMNFICEYICPEMYEYIFDSFEKQEIALNWKVAILL